VPAKFREKALYYLIDSDGKEYGPIVADNPEHDTFGDASILMKVTTWAARLGYTWRKDQ
jgi:hypothetical protein